MGFWPGECATFPDPEALPHLIMLILLTDMTRADWWSRKVNVYIIRGFLDIPLYLGIINLVLIKWIILKHILL